MGAFHLIFKVKMVGKNNLIQRFSRLEEYPKFLLQFS
jgi:hypothetical protein